MSFSQIDTLKVKIGTLLNRQLRVEGLDVALLRVLWDHHETCLYTLRPSIPSELGALSGKEISRSLHIIPHSLA